MTMYFKQPQLKRAWRLGVLRSDLLGNARQSYHRALERQPKSLSTLHPWNVTNCLRRGNQLLCNRVLTDYGIRWSSSDGVKWLWEADKSIVGFNEGNKYGTRTACVEYTFNSVKPLEPQDFRQAFRHFIRIMPNMRTVIRPKGDSHWFCQPHDPKIDFEVMTDQDNFREDCFNLLSQGFQDTDSTPWKARLIERDPDALCHVEGVKENYPYQYDLIMLYNHALLDGIDLQPMITCLHKILDDIAGGKVISDDAIGVFENNREIEELLNQRRKKLLQDEKHYDLIKRSLPTLGDVPSIIQAFPRPDVSKVTTKHVLRTINSQLLKGLLSKCSEKKVTFNSLCIATCNVALTELMQEAGLKWDSYKLACLIFMDARRYITVEKHLHGCHVLALTYMSETQGNEKDSFWEYCTKVNHKLKQFYQTEGRSLDQAVVQKMLDADNPSFNYTDYPRPASHDYSIGNLGDLTHTLRGDGTHVQLTNMISFNKIHNFRNCLLQEIYTFRGKTQYTLSYDTNYFSEETTNLIADKIFRLFETFVE